VTETAPPIRINFSPAPRHAVCLTCGSTDRVRHMVCVLPIIGAVAKGPQCHSCRSEVVGFIRNAPQGLHIISDEASDMDLLLPPTNPEGK
jgi:hypothetical protein